MLLLLVKTTEKKIQGCHFSDFPMIKTGEHNFCLIINVDYIFIYIFFSCCLVIILRINTMVLFVIYL